METENTETTKKAESFVSGLLTGWGVPANWARVIAGAIIGAIIALTTPSCTVSYSQAVTPEGATTTQYESALDPLPLKELLAEECEK